MRCRKLILILGASSVVGWTDSAAVRGPVMGFIFDAPSRAIRQVLGVPGAAYLGSPAVSNIEAASVSPDGYMALTIRGAQLTLYTGLREGSAAAIQLDGTITNADRFAWSADSNAARKKDSDHEEWE